MPSPRPFACRGLPSFRALAALFVLALRQQVRGWRLVVLGLLFLLPGVLAVLVYLTSRRGGPTVRRPPRFSSSSSFST